MLEQLLSSLKSTEDMSETRERLRKMKNDAEVFDALERIYYGQLHDVNIRCRALDLMQYLNPARAKDILIAQIQSPESTIRWKICGLLSDYGEDDRISATLGEVVLHDKDVDLRLVAVFALSKTGTPNAIPVLERAEVQDHQENWENRRISDYTSDAIREIRLRNFR